MKKLNKKEASKFYLEKDNKSFHSQKVKSVVDECKLLKKGEGIIVDPKTEWDIISEIGTYLKSYFLSLDSSMKFKTRKMVDNNYIIIRIK